MKVLYGVQGTGNGHISRAIALAGELGQYPDVQTELLISGRPPEELSIPVSRINWRSGLTFVVEAGEIRPVKTALCNNPFMLIRDITQQSLDDYDLVITDFEPIVAWAAKLRRRHAIGIAHQYAFRYEVPLGRGGMLDRALLKNLAPAGQYIGLHWHHFNQPILPPIVHVDASPGVKVENKVVVYLPFEDQLRVIELLKKCPDYEFYIYSPEHNDSDDGHIHLRKTSRTTFKQELCTAGGVICNTGFELISECLTLGIRVLTKPLNGQIEQLANAAALRELDYATVMDDLGLSYVKRWLSDGEPVKVTFPNTQRCLARWLANGAIDPVEDLAESLWREVIAN